MTLRDLTPWRSTRLPVHSGFGDPFRMFHREMDRLFNDFTRGFGAPSRWSDVEETAYLMPRLDVDETDTAYEISVELPGIDEKDVEMTLVDGVLTIKGEKKTEKEEKDKGHLHVERSFGSFQRALSLPTDADEEKVEATFKNGVLKAVIRKKAETKPATKRIDIKTK